MEVCTVSLQVYGMRLWYPLEIKVHLMWGHNLVNLLHFHFFLFSTAWGQLCPYPSDFLIFSLWNSWGSQGGIQHLLMTSRFGGVLLQCHIRQIISVPVIFLINCLFSFPKVDRLLLQVFNIFHFSYSSVQYSWNHECTKVIKVIFYSLNKYKPVYHFRRHFRVANVFPITTFRMSIALKRPGFYARLLTSWLEVLAI